MSGRGGDPATGLPEGPSLPPVLQRLAWAERPTSFALSCLRRHGSVFTLRFGRGLTLVAVADARLARWLHDLPTDAIGRGNAPMRRWLLGASSVSVLDGEEHSRHRQLLRPALHADAVARHEQAVEAAVGRMVAACPTDEPIDLLGPLRRLVGEAQLDIVLGLRAPGQRARGLELLLGLLDARMRVTPSIPLVRRWWGPGVPSRRLERAAAAVDHHLRDLIACRRAAPEAGAADVLSTLLRATDADGATMSDDELRDELLTLLVHGHAPTVSALAWSFERVAKDPEAAATVRARPAAGEGPGADEVVREVLRLRPPAWLTTARHTTRPLVLAGHHLPIGTMITGFTWLVHRDPAAFVDPSRFDPGRYLTDARPEGWMPFGGGHRRCLGDELAVLIVRTALEATLDRRRVTSPSPLAEPEREVGVVFLPADGLRVLLRSPS